MSYDEKDEERIDSDSLSETIEKETEATPPSDRFTQLMFGNRVPNKYREQHNSQEKQVEEQNNEVNYFTLMEQIDDIMGSLENLKPVLKEFGPIVDYIKKKMK
ncbi:hypothetical protein [Bacillus sp. J37]|uniref:hypothetical protein n=1 Tax=Bacillus sp. J37 TaxID=935837 RepID=UPI0004AD97E4|nr:hypothetical protein [Bacillus sp. J37]